VLPQPRAAQHPRHSLSRDEKPHSEQRTWTSMRNALAPPTERNLLNKGAKGNALNAEVATSER
jgi:hypothetical protein